MGNKERISRKKIIWGFSIVLKHLNWYIETSEVIPSSEKGPLLDSLTDAHRQLVKADRIEDRFRTEEQGELEAVVNQKRAELGKKPWKGRRLVDELIRAILSK
jgi:hypothetical protein